MVVFRRGSKEAYTSRADAVESGLPNVVPPVLACAIGVMRWLASTDRHIWQPLLSPCSSGVVSTGAEILSFSPY